MAVGWSVRPEDARPAHAWAENVSAVPVSSQCRYRVTPCGLLGSLAVHGLCSLGIYTYTGLVTRQHTHVYSIITDAKLSKQTSLGLSKPSSFNVKRTPTGPRSQSPHIRYLDAHKTWYFLLAKGIIVPMASESFPSKFSDSIDLDTPILWKSQKLSVTKKSTRLSSCFPMWPWSAWSNLYLSKNCFGRDTSPCLASSKSSVFMVISSQQHSAKEHFAVLIISWLWSWLALLVLSAGPQHCFSMSCLKIHAPLWAVEWSWSRVLIPVPSCMFLGSLLQTISIDDSGWLAYKLNLYMKNTPLGWISTCVCGESPPCSQAGSYRRIIAWNKAFSVTRPPDFNTY